MRLIHLLWFLGFLASCGVPHSAGYTLQEQLDICHGEIDKKVADLIIGPSYEDCLWTDDRPHVILDRITCKYRSVDTQLQKENHYERWTWTGLGVTVLLKEVVKIIYYAAPNAPACAAMFFGQDQVDDPDYLVPGRCTTVTHIMCVKL